MQRILVIRASPQPAAAPDDHDHASTVDRLVLEWGRELGLDVRRMETDDTGAAEDALGRVWSGYDGIILGHIPGGPLDRALHRLLELTDVPFVEVVPTETPLPRSDGGFPTHGYRIHGRGPDGYRWALLHLKYRAAWPFSTYRSAVHPDRVADLRLPDGEGPHPVVVLYHGGFWREHWTRDLMDGLAVDLVRRGMATWNVEYRRIPPIGAWRTIVGDAVDAVEALDRIGSRSALDLDDVTVLGHSAGGQLAMLAATLTERVRPRRVVSLAGVLDLAAVYDPDDPDNGPRRLLGPDGAAAFAATSPIERVPIGVNQLVVHGRKDAVVPIEVSTSYAAVAAAAGDSVETLWLDDTGHMEIIEPDSNAWKAIAARI